MRVLSCHPGYTLQLFEGQDKHETDRITGQSYTVVKVPALIARFISGADGAGIKPEEVQLALAKWDRMFAGKPDETLGNPAPYISVYDTEAQKIINEWSDEYHEAVCERFRFLAPDRTDRMMIVEDVPAVAPFPAYDSKSPEDIIAFLEWSEGDPSFYLVYEQENANRPELVAAFIERLIRAEEGEVIASVSA